MMILMMTMMMMMMMTMTMMIRGRVEEAAEILDKASVTNGRKGTSKVLISIIFIIIIVFMILGVIV